MVTLLSLALMVTLANPQAPATLEVAPVWEAAHILYARSNDSWFPVCMATPFDKAGDVTFFVTAAHCLRGDAYGVAREIGATISTPATVVSANSAKDLAVLRTQGVQTTVLALGTDPVVGEDIVVAIAPAMFARILATGNVASELGSVPGVWESAVFIYLHGAPGASGGAVYSRSQHAVVAILVGHLVDLHFLSVAVPISELREISWQ